MDQQSISIGYNLLFTNMSSQEDQIWEEAPELYYEDEVEWDGEEIIPPDNIGGQGMEQPQPPLPDSLPVPTSAKPKIDLPPITLQYSDCPKLGFHQGEKLSLVCLQKECQQNPSICVICLDESHQGHKVRSLKAVVDKARVRHKQFDNLVRCKDTLKVAIDQSESSVTENVRSFDTKSMGILEELKGAISDCHNKIRQQFDLRGNEEQTISQIHNLSQEEMSPSEFITFIKNLREGVPEDWKPEDQGANTEIEESIIYIKKSLASNFDTKSKELNEDMKDISKEFEKKHSIFSKHQDFEFSPDLKYTAIQVIDKKKVIKKTQGSNYHVALVQPSLNFTQPNQKYAFKVSEGLHTWSALGIASKSKMKQSKYIFNPSKTNHGLQMISSNSGSWSNNPEYNSTVNSFMFKSGDTVTVEYSKINSTSELVFENKRTGQKYEIPFVPEMGVDWNLGVILYYENDMMEIGGVVDKSTK